MPLNSAIEEIIHGVKVRDPFRWLEDRTLPQTAAWIDQQRQLLHTYFASISDLVSIEEQVRRYLNVELLDQPARAADLCFYRKRARGDEQGRICVREGEHGVERILFDPSRYGRWASASIYRVSADGNHLAISLRYGGSDRAEILFFDLRRGEVESRPLPHGLHRGLVFSRHGCFWCQETYEADEQHRIYYHPLDSTHEDTEIFRAPRSRGSRLILTGSACSLGALWLRPDGIATVADFWVAGLVDGTPRWHPLFRDMRMPYSPILWHDRVLVLTETSAGNSRMVELLGDGLERGLVPERRYRIRDVVPTRDRLFVSYLDEDRTMIEAWLPNGQQAESVLVPDGGTVQLLPSPAVDTDGFFYSYESHDVPPAIYEYCASSHCSHLWYRQDLPENHPSMSARQVTIPSKDDAAVPLTLVSSLAAGSALPRPVLMTGYGGFGVVLTPRFSVLASILIGFGAVLALPRIRGGGEFGKAWHEAGRAKNRQASFDDFIAAAEWIVREGITTPRQLGIFGGSNSGLLVAAAMTQRPDLFAAVLAIAPLLDMVRYEALDPRARWRHEYGTAEERGDFLALFRYSPYHRVEDNVDYPATLFVTGDKDERCPAAHVRKMAARLQGRAAQQAPILVDYSEQRGHAPTMPLSVRISSLARRIAFLCRELRLPVPEGRLP